MQSFAVGNSVAGGIDVREQVAQAPCPQLCDRVRRGV